MGSAHILVVMPLYNARPYIRAAIDSILVQTYPDFTLLVVNDGSTDGSEQDVAAFNDRRIILWNQENQGPGAAMNSGIQYAIDQQIPFLARMDADDISAPQRLETQIHLLEKFPAAAACSANCYYIDADSEKILSSSTISTSPGLIHWEIHHGLRGLIQGACVFRTNALAKIGGYRPKFKRAEEVDVFLRLSEQYELCNSSEYLYSIRDRANSYSLKNVQQNILFQFYALDCSKKRRDNKPEQDFETFRRTMSWATKYRIWREEYLLKTWRNRMREGHLPSLLLASLLDPRRVVLRVRRKLDEGKQK